MLRKNNKKSKKARKTKTTLSTQIAISRTLVGQAAEKIVQFNETIESVSGTSLPQWTTSSDNGIYIYPRFFAAADFTEMAAVYQRCKIQRIKIRVSRTYTETTGITIYPSGVPQMRIAFFPALTPTINNTDIADLESALVIQPYAVNVVEKEFPIIDIDALDGAGNMIINMANPFDTNATPSLTPRGVFGCGWKSIGGASSSSVIYDVQFQFLCRFDVPY